MAALISVEEGAQAAIAVALGAAADAVVVAGVDAAAAAISELKSRNAGQVGAVIASPGGPRDGTVSGDPAGAPTGSPGGPGDGTVSGDPAGPVAAIADTGVPGDLGDAPTGPPAAAWDGGAAEGRAAPPATPASRLPAHDDRVTLPPAVQYALDLVRAPEQLTEALAALLTDVVVAPDLGAAQDVVRAHPRLRVVTRDGDLLGTHWAYGGSAHGPSQLEVRAAADEAVARLAEADARCTVAARLLAAGVEEEEGAQRGVAEAAGILREAAAAAADVSGRLGRLGGAARAAVDEAARLATAIETAERSREADLGRLAELERRQDEVEAEAQLAASSEDSAGATLGDALAERREAARNAEMEARLAVRTAEERVRAISGRADALAAAAQSERAARERARRRRELRARQAVTAGAVAKGAVYATERIEGYVAAALAERGAAEAAGSARAAELKAVREQLRQLGAEHDKLVNAAHSAEIARAEQRLRLEQIEGRAVEEFGVNAEALIAEYGPDVPVPPAPDAPQDAVPSAYDRETQERRAGAAERQLARLGKVNPLALEEFAALEERHAFLSSQVEDLKKTRRDLLTVIKEVDDRVQQVFAAAYEDTAREFEQIIARLFPGGEGRLVLTEPDDMLTSGVEVEARPPGKKVKRLSLLSGGERSLTAIAYLVAIFKARPSPFYVLDEVEAALDDVNLQRLLAIFEELRESSQLIIITHQKRTMEVADALYGVTMRGDGVSAVVSQRLRERATA